MFYCCGITEKGVMPHNEDALMIGKNVITNGAVDIILILRLLRLFQTEYQVRLQEKLLQICALSF